MAKTMLIAVDRSVVTVTKTTGFITMTSLFHFNYKPMAMKHL